MPTLIGYVEQLTAKGKDGEPGVRFPATETQIGEMVCLSQSQRIARVPECCHECVVYLVRHTRGRKRELFRVLIGELVLRIYRIAGAFAQGIDLVSKEHILCRVEEQIFALILIKIPTRASDFLEVAFGLAVEHRTHNEVRRHYRSPFGRRGDVVHRFTEDRDDEEIDPMDGIPDNAPSAQAILLRSLDEETRAKWYWKACRAVKNPLHLEAVRLRYCDGMPVESADPETPDLAKYFNEKPKDIRNWIATALKQMRYALRTERQGGAK